MCVVAQVVPCKYREAPGTRPQHQKPGRRKGRPSQDQRPGAPEQRTSELGRRKPGHTQSRLNNTPQQLWGAAPWTDPATSAAKRPHRPRCQRSRQHAALRPRRPTPSRVDPGNGRETVNGSRRARPLRTWGRTRCLSGAGGIPPIQDPPTLRGRKPVRTVPGPNLRSLALASPPPSVGWTAEGSPNPARKGTGGGSDETRIKTSGPGQCPGVEFSRSTRPPHDIFPRRPACGAAGANAPANIPRTRGETVVRSRPDKLTWSGGRVSPDPATADRAPRLAGRIGPPDLSKRDTAGGPRCASRMGAVRSA
jgi:hypothetical protein